MHRVFEFAETPLQQFIPNRFINIQNEATVEEVTEQTQELAVAEVSAETPAASEEGEAAATEAAEGESTEGETAAEAESEETAATEESSEGKQVINLSIF